MLDVFRADASHLRSTRVDATIFMEDQRIVRPTEFLHVALKQIGLHVRHLTETFAAPDAPHRQGVTTKTSSPQIFVKSESGFVVKVEPVLRVRLDW